MVDLLESLTLSFGLSQKKNNMTKEDHPKHYFSMYRILCYHLSRSAAELTVSRVLGSLSAALLYRGKWTGMVDEPDENFWIEDDYRIDYLKDHFKAIQEAVEMYGIPVLGYTMWGGIDLASLATGEMKKCYRWIYADMDDKGGGSLSGILRKAFTG